MVAWDGIGGVLSLQSLFYTYAFVALLGMGWDRVGWNRTILLRYPLMRLASSVVAFGNEKTPISAFVLV